MTTSTTTIDIAPASVDRNSGRRASDLGLLGHQIRFEQRAFWRNRSRAFFSVAFPLIFLVTFNAINGGHHIQEMGGISYATWFVPGILAYGLIMTTFSNLAVSTAIARDTGVLKRIRGTSLPAWVYIGGRIGSALITTVVLVATTLTLGVFAYGVTVRTSTLVALAATLVLGSVCFTVLGLAATAIIPNADAAPAIVNVLILPLTFISGIWMVLANAPGWLDVTATIFPVHALAHGLQHASTLPRPATAWTGPTSWSLPSGPPSGCASASAGSGGSRDADHPTAAHPWTTSRRNTTQRSNP